MKKSYIGMIYFLICFIRMMIFGETSAFPMWVYAVWTIISFSIPVITASIEDITRWENDK